MQAKLEDETTATALVQLLATAARLCGASGGLLWLGGVDAPRLVASVGLADAEIAERLARAAAAVQRAEILDDLVGAPLGGDGELGGWCVFGATAPALARAAIEGLAAQATTLLALDERLARLRHTNDALAASDAQLREVVANMPIVVYVVDRAGLFTLSDGGGLGKIGLRPGQVVGLSVFDVYRDFPVIVGNMRQALAGVPCVWTAEVAGTVYETRTTCLRDAAGEISGVLGVAIDISERVQMEVERKRLQEEVIAVQEATLAELSTPLIPISRDTVVLPLIGVVDGARAERVLETLLAGIATTRARVAILDVTGVARMNAEVAQCLLRIARATRLLGAEMVITGIGPLVAQELVALNVDLAAVVIRGTLESGIAWAMRSQAPARDGV